MTLREFVRKNRGEIDSVIRGDGFAPGRRRINDEERRLWVLNDEKLYRAARAAGVQL